MLAISNFLKWSHRHYIPLLFALIVLLGAFLRLYQLADNVPALSQDEIVNGYDAYSLAHTLRDHHGNRLPITLESFGDSVSVALTYLTTPFVRIMGLNDFAVRLPIALTGIATIPFIYLFIRELTNNKNLALLGSFILATAPWHITLTRWAVPPSIVPFFFILFLWLFTAAFKRKEWTYYLIAAGVSGGLLTYSYPAAIVFAPLFVGGASLIFLWRRWRALFTVLGTYLIITAPLFYLILFNSEQSFRRLGAVRLPSTGFDFIHDVLSRYFEYFSPNFLFGSIGTNPIMHVPGAGNFYWYYGIIVLAAIIFALATNSLSNKKSFKKVFKLLPWRTIVIVLLLLVIAPVPAAITIDHEHVTRAIALFPVYTLLITGAVYYAIRKSKQYTVLVSFIFVALTLGFTVNYFITYTTKYRAESAYSFQYGIRESLKEIFALDTTNKFTNIVIDSNINQPYIYYLYYSHYNPRLIKQNLSEAGPYVVNAIGKYKFQEITPQDLAGARRIMTVKQFGQQWYGIYQKNNVIYLKKLYT